MAMTTKGYAPDVTDVTPDEADWYRRHAAELANTWRDRFESSSGFDIKPVYTPADLARRGWSFEKDLGFPGEPPYVRGLRAAGYRQQLWKWELYAGFGAAEDANQRYRYLLEQGSTGGISIALDLPTQIGLDSDHPLARDEVGQVGVALCSLHDFERLFEGIPLAKVGQVVTTANCIGPVFVAWLLVLCEKHGVNPTDLILNVQNDPLKEYVARGTQFLPIKAAVRLATDVIQYVSRIAPNWYPISVSGSHMKQAGGSCVQEAAFTICNGIAYVEACLAKGMRIDDFGHQIELHFCTDMDFFEEIAKYRAVRKVWTRLVRERFRGTTARAEHFRLHATTSGLPLTAQQPRNNIVRITLQALAQILGGAEGTRTASYDEALSIPTQEAVTIAIRTNQIIAHETGIPYTVDPLGGSYFVECLTYDMEQRIWEYIRKVDEMGGAIAAIEQGFYQRELADGAYRQQRLIDEGKNIIVGVNAFRVDEEVEPSLFEVDPSAAERQIENLRKLRQNRDDSAVQRALRELREVCRSGENVMPATIAAVRAYATLGEICQVWREVFGEYRIPVVRL